MLHAGACVCDSPVRVSNGIDCSHAFARVVMLTCEVTFEPTALFRIVRAAVWFCSRIVRENLREHFEKLLKSVSSADATHGKQERICSPWR